MNINNPFESGHIKNYVLLYVSVVVIMILFFLASTLFNDVQKVQKKVFDSNVSSLSPNNKDTKIMKNVQETNGSRFRLMNKTY